MSRTSGYVLLGWSLLAVVVVEFGLHGAHAGAGALVAAHLGYMLRWHQRGR